MEKQLGNENEMIELLKNKCDLLERVLKITSTFAEKLNEQGAEEYIYLIDRRRSLFEDLATVDGKLQIIGFEMPRSTQKFDSNSDITILSTKIKKLAEHIFKIDQSMSGTVDRLMVEVKSNLKNMAANKNITNVYANDTYKGVSRFDSRK